MVKVKPSKMNLKHIEKIGDTIFLFQKIIDNSMRTSGLTLLNSVFKSLTVMQNRKDVNTRAVAIP